MKKKASKRNRYERPDIAPFVTRHPMKQPARTYSPGQFEKVDGLWLRDLVRRFSTPLYVVSEESLRRKYREFRASFIERYPDTTISWSYKTNFLSAICAVFHSEGAWAEVVSGFEYAIAKRLGVSGDHTIFNGPYKKDEELLHAFKRRSIVNIDSFTELDRSIKLARRERRKFEIGIRVNMNLNFPAWDKFGFNFENGDALDACRRATTSGVLGVRGFHMHLGTFVTDTALYTKGMERLIQLSHAAESEFDAPIEYIDMGGGFASENTLHSQFLKGEAANPTFEQYADAITTPLAMNLPKFKGRPRLFLEPGRSIVDEGVSLLTRVVSIKQLANGQKAAIVDAGVNLLPTSYWYGHDVVALKESQFGTEEYHVLGALCMQIDVIRTGAPLPPLSEGDLLLIRNVGAYNYSQSMIFIYPRPAWVMVSDGKVHVIREPETFEWIAALDRIPRHLLNPASERVP